MRAPLATTSCTRRRDLMVEMLTTVPRAQAWMAPDQGALASTTDQIVGRLIGAVSQMILGEMNRDQLQRTLRTETYPGGRTGRLVLRQWPVVSIQSLGIGAWTPIIDTDYTLTAPTSGGGTQRLELLNGRTFFGGASVAYLSGFVTTETVLVPTGSNPTFETQQKWLADHGVTAMDGTPVDYTVSLTGVYSPAPATAGQQVLVTYSYVPMDIEQVVIDEVAASFRSRQRIGEVSKALPQGGGTLSYAPRRLMDISLSALQRYKRVVPI